MSGKTSQAWWTDPRAPKPCTACERELTPEHFGAAKGQRHGKASVCRRCVADRAADRRRRNPEAGRAATRRYKASAVYVAYLDRSEVARRQARADYYARTREAALARVAAWVRDNPERRAANSQRGNHARRARLVLAERDHWRVADVRARDGDTCYLCHKPVRPDLPRHHPDRLVIDHVIPLAKGGSDTFDNVRVACWLCNNRKGARAARPPVARARRDRLD